MDKRPNAAVSSAARACPPQRGRRRRGLVAEEAGLSFAARKQRHLLFLLTRQLAEAQFVRADGARAQRLWNEAAALDLDPERIIHLLYGVADHTDSAEMEAVDRHWCGDQAPLRRGWWAPRLGRLMGRDIGVWPQSAPPAATPAHP